MPTKFPSHHAPRAPSTDSDTSLSRSHSHSTIDTSPISTSHSASLLPSKAARQSTTELPPHYTLPPTFPSPYSGTLDASLDAILAWGQRGSVLRSVQRLVSTLLEEVNSRTNWGSLLDAVYDTPGILPQYARYVITELLFLVTRTLLPEQIAENRGALGRLYEHRKQLAIRLVLRYDMLREWKLESGHSRRDHPVAVASLAPGEGDGGVMAPPLVPAAYPKKYPFRRPLMPNVIPTLIAAPVGDFRTTGMRERMKHHVTDLDAYLVLRDEEVERWSAGRLKAKTCIVLLHWQWLRQNNKMLEDMEFHGWEQLDVKADECEWIADDVKKVRTWLSMERETKKETKKALKTLG